MGSNAKKKTTFSKLNREQKLRERRIEKQVRKNARKLAAARQSDVEAAAGRESVEP